MTFKTKHSSYLGLPMEIRQKILHYTTTDEDLEDDVDLVCKRGATGYECQKFKAFNGSTMMFWADTLKSVDTEVEDDMCFVLKRWKSRGQELADEKPGTGCEEHDSRTRAYNFLMG